MTPATTSNNRFRSVVAVLLLVLLFIAVYRLPPDTTLATVEAGGVLRACVPHELPPLVTGDSDHPGIDIEVLQAVAERMGLRLQLTRNAAIGRDFNPRNWRLTRAQCLVIAGGVVDTAATRSFLETTNPYLETGWAAVATNVRARLQDGTVGFHAGLSGLDRLALSAFLRAQGATIELVPTARALREGLAAGTFGVAVTDALSARLLADELGAEATAMWLPEPQARHGLGLGLWKGDLTLKRRIEAVIAELRADGSLGEILDRYELASIGETCTVCSAPEAQ